MQKQKSLRSGGTDSWEFMQLVCIFEVIEVIKYSVAQLVQASSLSFLGVEVKRHHLWYRSSSLRKS
jgi:hypothetical protein